MDNGAESYRRYLNGDESAFVEVQRLYFDNLTRFINRYVNDIYASEDLAIDAMVELVVHPHRYDFRTSLKTYLFAIGRHKALDYVRHRSRLKFERLPDAEADAEAIDRNYADCDALDESLISNERRLAVNAAVMKLPEQMRAAVHLVYFEGMSYADAAKVMRKAKKQIDNLLYRAKAELRKILGNEEEWL